MASFENAVSLLEVQELVAQAISAGVPDRLWLIAEIASVNTSRGHIYIELIQKEGGAVVAKAKATIWSSNARKVLGDFTVATGQAIAAGMNALICVSAKYHPQFGFSFQILAIDGSFTLGELARQKREVINKLTIEGLIDRNKQHIFPIVPQRVAVISSNTAAGFGDFLHQMTQNTYGYKFTIRLFEALMQGEKTESSIVGALREVRSSRSQFDLVVIIRGGGSKTDLHWFDSYALCRAIASFDLPVLTGIGHERDESVADMVAFQRFKTPTAVAEFLLQTTMRFEQELLDLQIRIGNGTQVRLDRFRTEIDNSVRRFQQAVTQLVTGQNQVLSMSEESLRVNTKHRIEREITALDRYEDKVKLLDPINVLKRGYSLAYLGEQLVKSIKSVESGSMLRIVFADGSAEGKIESVLEHPD